MSLSIPLTSLTRHWPRERTISRQRVLAVSSEYSIGPYSDTWKGFPVHKRSETGSQHVFYISKVYHHALRFLNFKNACYIAALAIDSTLYDLSDDDRRSWAIMQDGMARNLIFNNAVRDAIFAELSKPLGASRELGVPNQPNRSKSMDTWLVQEYKFRAHHPDACRTCNTRQPFKSDPAKFGVCGLLHCSVCDIR